MLGRALLTCFSFALILGAGCKKKAQPPPADPAPVPAAAPVEKNVLIGLEALQYIPKDAAFVAAADSFDAMAQRFGRDAVVAKFKEGYTKGTAKGVRKLGFDVFDPAGWRKGGLDPSKPFGAAIIDEVDETMVMFAAVADRVVAEKMVAAMNMPRYLDALIRGNTLLLIMSDKETKRLALAGVAKEGSMAANKDMLAAVKAMPYGAAAGGYWNINAMLKVMNLAPEAERFLRDLVGGTVVAGAGIEGRSIVSRARFAFNEAALLRKLGRNLSDVPVLVRAAEKKPSVMMQANFDMAALLDLIKRLAFLGGEDDPIETLKQQLGGLDIDLEKQVLTALSGEVGLIIDTDLAISLTPPKNSKEFASKVGGHVVIGLKDVAKMKAVMGIVALATKSEIFKVVDDVFVIEIPEWRTVYVGIAGDYLVGSSDKAMLARVAAGKGDSYAPKLKHDQLRALLSHKELAGAGTIDQSLTAWAFWMAAAFQTGLRDPGKAGKRDAAAEKTIMATGTAAGSISVTPTGWDVVYGQFFDASSLPELVMLFVEFAKADSELERGWETMGGPVYEIKEEKPAAVDPP